MSKRSADDEAQQTDMEVGMTTAERRRRRRRGGGLRVPSDNVPRTRAPTAPPAPRPEDPALAMSIAYSFASDASGPVARVTDERFNELDDDEVSGAIATDPAVEPMDDAGADGSAPELAPTMLAPLPVVDLPDGAGGSIDFESKTRVMDAVDLEALGLDENGQSLTTIPQERIASPAAMATQPSIIVDEALQMRPQLVPQPPVLPSAKRPPSDSDVDVVMDVPLTDEQTAIVDEPPAPPPTPPPPPNVPDWIERADRAERSSPIRGEAPFGRAPTVPPPVPTHAPATSDELEAQRLAANSRRLQTVALSEEDLEEVRAATQPTLPRTPAKPITKPPPLNIHRLADVRSESDGVPHGAAPSRAPQSQPTQQLQAVDIEIIAGATPAPGSLSVPELALDELNDDRASSSGEIEVEVDDSRPITIVPQPSIVVEAPKPPRVLTNPSVPPPMHKADGAHHSPPPPPPAAIKPPPAPQAKKPPAPAAAAADKPAEKPIDKSSDKTADKVVRGKPWFVDLFDEDYLRTLPFLTAQATQAEAEFVIETLGLAPGAQVLDVGCGYGRHAMELAARGFHVVGLDLSTSLLLRGGEEAARRGLTINFVRGDMRELDFESQFDGAYCLFSTFGYFDDETNKKALQNVARALKPNAKVVIEILNRDYVIADLPTRVWWEGDGCVVLEEVDLNYFSSRIQVNRSVVFDDGRQLEQEISVRAYSLHEVGKLMHAAGFRVLEISGGYQTRGRFFGNQSRHIIVLAERKDMTS